jgi:hypothetical protein
MAHMVTNGATHPVVLLVKHPQQTQIILCVMLTCGLRFREKVTEEKITGQELVASGPFMQNN